MAGLLNLRSDIVMVQYIPGCDSFIVFRTNGDVAQYYGMDSIADSDIGAFIRECRTSGSFKATSFKVPSGKVSDAMLPCEEIIYSKQFGVTPSPSKLGGKNPIAFLQGGVNWVVWSPTLRVLSVNAGRLSMTKHLSVATSDYIPEDIKEYMSQCYSAGFYAKRKDYSRPVREGYTVHIRQITDFYFSKTVLTSDFAERYTSDISPEDAAELGLHT